MSFWVTLIAYEVVWFATVFGAGRGSNWPGAIAAALFIAWRLMASTQRNVELRLAIVALLFGLLFEGLCVGTGLIRYAAAWPLAWAPLWLIALWVVFALTILPLFGYLHARPWLAALFGALGGPLAYLAAARGWHVVVFVDPAWRGLLAVAIGWGIAMPLLCTLARRWMHQGDVTLAHGSAS